jgi:hypothetical protein
MKDGKILPFGGGNICLFCGQQMKTKFVEYETYFECDCPDAIKDRKIDEQIRKLKYQRPQPKFEIREEQVLYKKNEQ